MQGTGSAPTPKPVAKTLSDSVSQQAQRVVTDIGKTQAPITQTKAVQPANTKTVSQPKSQPAQVKPASQPKAASQPRIQATPKPQTPAKTVSASKPQVQPKPVQKAAPAAKSAPAPAKRK
jgi:hypothetical protein